MTNDRFQHATEQYTRRKRPYGHPELTPCSRFMQGNAAIFCCVVYALVASQIPWEWLYQQPWYRTWIDVVAHWSPNIRKLPNSPSQIVELASAYLAFTNTLGPFYVLASVLCALKHVQNPELYARNRDFSTWLLFKYLLMAIFIVPVMFYGALGYEGGSRTIAPTDLFYTSGPAFIGVNVAGWWASATYTFGLVTVICMFGERWLVNKR